jgi:hypothetical protein
MRRIGLDQAKHERFRRHHVERLEGDVADLNERVLDWRRGQVPDLGTTGGTLLSELENRQASASWCAPDDTVMPARCCARVSG